MPETIRPTNPYRDQPDNLIKKEKPFLEDFAGATPEELKAAGIEETGNDENRMMNDETKPTDPNQLATPEEIERHENELVKCAGIEVTNKEKRQIEEIIRRLNADRQQNGLEKVELGKEIKLYKMTLVGISKEQLSEELQMENIKLSEFVQKKLDGLHVAPRDLLLIRLSVADLGFPEHANIEAVFKKGISLGMESCPKGTGFQFRLLYKDQPLGDSVSVGEMQHIDTGRYLDVYEIAHIRGELWLDGYPATPSFPVNLDTNYLFSL